MEEELVTVVKKPKAKPKNEIKPIQNEEKQVIVHCAMPCEWGMGARIWKTTYLITESNEKIQLLFWEGISLAPMWTRISHNGLFQFTLIFKGLPSGCKVFSLVEEIPEPGGFKVIGIKRNKTDVYRVKL